MHEDTEKRVQERIRVCDSKVREGGRWMSIEEPPECLHIGPVEDSNDIEYFDQVCEYCYFKDGCRWCTIDEEFDE
jgi:hypothetical protein